MRVFRFIIALFLLHAPCEAAGPNGKTSCRFLGLEGIEAPPPLLNVSPDGVEVACTVPIATLSPDTACFAKGEAMAFVAASDRKLVATATIPAGVTSAILVFIPAPKPAQVPWKVLVIDDSAKTLPDAGAFVANLYNQEVRFVLGASKIMLKAGTSHSLPRPEPRDEFNMAPVVFQFQQKQDKWATASESMLRFVPGARYLMFAYVDPASGRPRIMTCKDSYRPPPPPPP
ncbi:hypothetical protein [Luteolibacter sp. Populi]|uniref:hypothetical protein n=1 Tax=Luteolibacter sp. Populi TaxID=3230487 RepID=UPI003465BAD1